MPSCHPIVRPTTVVGDSGRRVRPFRRPVSASDLILGLPKDMAVPLPSRRHPGHIVPWTSCEGSACHRPAPDACATPSTLPPRAAHRRATVRAGSQAGGTPHRRSYIRRTWARALLRTPGVDACCRSRWSSSQLPSGAFGHTQRRRHPGVSASNAAVPVYVDTWCRPSRSTYDTSAASCSRARRPGLDDPSPEAAGPGRPPARTKKNHAVGGWLVDSATNGGRLGPAPRQPGEACAGCHGKAGFAAQID